MGLIGEAEAMAANAVVPGSGALVHIWLWLLKHWQTVVVVLAVFGLALTLWRAPWAESRQKAKDQAQIAALQKTITDLKVASDQAAVANKAYVQKREAAQDAITKGQTDALSKELVDARAAVAGWLRVQAAARHAGGGGLSQTSNPSPSVDGTGQSAVVPVSDLGICAENTVKAKGWQDWWSEQAIVR